jgi:hypothetical protein
LSPPPGERTNRNDPFSKPRSRPDDIASHPGREEVGYLDPFAVAVAHAALGETETAAHWVRRTYDDRSPSAFCLLTEPLLDPARDEPAFREVIRRLAFPSR